MNTEIKIRETHMGQQFITGETFATVEEARRKIADLRDPANDGKYDDYEFEIVRVCDDMNDERYGEVVEVIE